MESFHWSTPEAYTRIVDELSMLPSRDSRAGPQREAEEIVVESQDPRCRQFFRPNYNLAFQLQEMFAYWNGLNPGHVQRYNSNMEMFMTDGRLNGSAYGERLRYCPHDQIERVIDKIMENPGTRQAVATIHNPYVENYDGPDVACTLYLHFKLRDGALNLTTNMRSQDMYWGYTYDVVAFQWLQEVIAGILDVELGSFTHMMNSCHYYTDREDEVLDSAGAVKASPSPDCRLESEVLSGTMEQMMGILEDARAGTPPSEVSLDDLPTYYDDWARVMVAYELSRFHDEPEKALNYAAGIDQYEWRQWTFDKCQ